MDRLELPVAYLALCGLAQRAAAGKQPIGDEVHQGFSIKLRLAEELQAGRSVVEQCHLSLLPGEARRDAQPTIQALGQIAHAMLAGPREIQDLGRTSRQ